MIKKIILTSTLLTTSLLSNQLDEIIDLYNAKQFNKLCSQATLAKYTSLQNNEQFWTIFSQACIEIDLISNISTPINKLIHSKDARENAVFLSTILYQKKLLYYAIVDDIDISYVRLPRIDHMLSVIFDNYVIGNYTMDGNTIVIKENDDTYTIDKIIANDNTNRLVIKTFKDGNLTKTRMYW